MPIEPLVFDARKPGLAVDLDRLVSSRMLIQANSGGGKSRSLRYVLEQTFGHVQHVVLDPEGEFSSLRERFPYLLAAPTGGDVVADPRSAKLLCRRVMELGVSVVVDLYDLKLPDRRKFVRLFLEELMHLPRTLWHPALVVVDEAHNFCPERGSGEAESTEAVITLCTQGRKRGFAAVLATQRLSKLHKDAAAELLNKMVGRTGLDVDVKRAGDELGFDKEGRARLPHLEPGEFFVFGPAISREVKLVTTGEVVTSHPEPGTVAPPAPPAPEKIRALAAQLRDLPQEAEAEARDAAALTSRVRDLEAKLRVAEKRTEPDPAVIQRLTAERDAMERRAEAAESDMAAAQEDAARVRTRLGEVAELAGSALPAAPEASPRPRVASPPRAAAQPPGSAPAAAPPAPPRTPNAPVDLGKAERAILQVLSQHPAGCEANKLTLLAGYTWSGGFRNSLAKLRGGGLIEGSNGATMTITPAGEACGPFEPLPRGEALREYWINHPRFGKAEREVLRYLAGIYPSRADREEICAATGYTWSGGFRNALSALRTAGVITGSNSEQMSAAPHLFGEA